VSPTYAHFKIIGGTNMKNTFELILKEVIVKKWVPV